MALLASPTAGERAVLVVSTGSPHRRLRRRRPWPARGPRARCCARRCPQGMGTAGEPAVRGHQASSPTRSTAANEAVVAAHARGLGATRRRHVRRGGRRGLRCCRTPTSATAGPTGCPTAAGRPAHRRRLGRAAADRRPACPRARGRDRAAGARDHPLARRRRARPRPARRRSSPSTPPGWVLVCSDGLWNYASEPDALVAQIDRGRRPATRRRWPLAPRSTSPTRRAARTTSPSPWPGSPGRMPEHACRPSARHEGAVRWLSSPPTSTRTSSCPTAAPTSTRSSRSPAPAPAPPARPAAARPARSSSSTRPARWAARRWRPPSRRPQAALDEIVDGTWFAVIAGRDRASWPTRRSRRVRAWCRWTPSTRSRGHGGDRRVRGQRRHGDRHLARPGRHRCSRRCPR